MKKVTTADRRLDWPDLMSGHADLWDGAEVEISGWVTPIDAAERHDYFLLVPESICCVGCSPSNPSACIEVFAATAIAVPAHPVRLAGRWCRLVDDPTGWRYQLRDARLVDAEGAGAVTRRTILSAGALAALAACAPHGSGPDAADSGAARQLVTGTLTVDIHSHAGRILRSSAPLEPVAAPMREGGMAVLCLAMVADSPATRLMPDRRIRAVREPEPGELYAWSRTAFARLLELAEEQELHIITDVAALRTAASRGPSIIVSAEGADFLDSSIERLDEAYTTYRLRHLQLTHYRVNELGDIQTEPPVHGGLTDFGVEVIRACNRRGIVVDTAHGTYDLVKRAAAVTSKPLVLSHTSLTRAPGPTSRQISPDHARVIAETGGVIGVWPPSSIFADLNAFVEGFARMVDVAGIDHVGLGSDMLGLTVPSVFDSYRDLPLLAHRLLAHGFTPEEAGKLLGGNYARVFAATVT
jgi:membrane dipeptidase